MEKKRYEFLYQVEEDYWWYVSRRKIFDKVFRSFLKNSNTKILDVGFGTGGNFEVLKKFGNVSGLDINEEAIKYCSLKFPELSLYHGSLLKNFNLENEKFNLITFLDVVEHIDEDLLTLKVAKEKLEKDGKIFLTVPAYNFLWNHTDYLTHHKRRYNKKSFEDLINKSGLEIEYISFFNTFLAIPIIIGKLLAKIKKYNPQEDDLIVPNKFVNYILEKIFTLETRFLPKYKFCFGISIMALCKVKK